MPETYIVEGRILELQRDTDRLTLAVDIERVLRRAWPPEPVEIWATDLVIPIGQIGQSHGIFDGPAALGGPTLARGQRVRLLATPDGDANHLKELAVLSQVTRRFTFPRIDASVSLLAPRLIGVQANRPARRSSTAGG